MYIVNWHCGRFLLSNIYVQHEIHYITQHSSSPCSAISSNCFYPMLYSSSLYIQHMKAVKQLSSTVWDKHTTNYPHSPNSHNSEKDTPDNAPTKKNEKKEKMLYSYTVVRESLGVRENRYMRSGRVYTFRVENSLQKSVEKRGR